MTRDEEVFALNGEFMRVFGEAIPWAIMPEDADKAIAMVKRAIASGSMEEINGLFNFRRGLI